MMGEPLWPSATSTSNENYNPLDEGPTTNQPNNFRSNCFPNNNQSPYFQGQMPYMPNGPSSCSNGPSNMMPSDCGNSGCGGGPPNHCHGNGGGWPPVENYHNQPARYDPTGGMSNNGPPSMMMMNQGRGRPNFPNCNGNGNNRGSGSGCNPNGGLWMNGQGRPF